MRQRGLGHRARVEHQIIVALRQRVDRRPQHLGNEQLLRIVPDIADRHEMQPRAAVAGDDIAERGRAAHQVGNAGADGSLEITSIFGEANDRSTSTTRAERASMRAKRDRRQRGADLAGACRSPQRGAPRRRRLPISAASAAIEWAGRARARPRAQAQVRALAAGHWPRQAVFWPSESGL